MKRNAVILCLICSIFYIIVPLIFQHNLQCSLIVTLFRISAELSILLKKVFRLVVQVVPAGGRGQSFTIKSRLAVGNTSLRFSDGADRVAPGTPVNFSETFR